MKIDFANLQHQYQLYKKEIDANIQKVLDNSNYIMGDEIRELEGELEKFTKATGIKAVVDKVSEATGKPCGCGQRRDTLNRVFPYQNNE